MSKWEIAIAVRNEPEAHRKQEGDIIAFKPAPWIWGSGGLPGTPREIEQCLIVIVDGMTQDEVLALCFPMYEGGELDEEVILANKLIPVGKRRYRLPLVLLRDGWLPSLDTQRVRNRPVGLVYQPFKDNNIIIDTTEKVAIFQDKFTETYKYNKKRKA